MILERRSAAVVLMLLALALLAACDRPAALGSPTEAATATPVPTHELDGTEWMLTSLQGASPLAGTQVLLSFSEGQVRGSSGCNRYRGAYAVDGRALTFGPLAATRMVCADPLGIMEQEQRYLDLLGGVRRYRVDGAQLWLATDAGLALVFRAPTLPTDCLDPGTYPPEDAELVWPTLLEASPSPAAPGQEVQIRGTGGYLTWETACGVGYDESARSFALSLDGAPAGPLECYANTCLARVALPDDVTPGQHTLSVEGGARLEIQVRQEEP